MNFGTDTTQIKDLADKLKSNATKVETIIGNIYSKLEGLNGSGWQGTGYDQFLADCNAYKDALNQIPDVINDFASFFEGKVHSNAETLHSEVKSGYEQVEQA